MGDVQRATCNGQIDGVKSDPLPYSPANFTGTWLNSGSKFFNFDEKQMETKIAVLRGINVGGKRKVPMADLRALCQQTGMGNVKTYIQSGNIVFRSAASSEQLAEMLTNEIKTRFGFEVPVIVRTGSELAQAITDNPFYNKKADIGKLHLAFLNALPENVLVKQAETQQYKPDQFAVIGRSVFVYCEGKYHQSRLSNSFFEKKLNVSASTRNWKTVLKLAELCKQEG